jgi:hypothetical protein
MDPDKHRSSGIVEARGPYVEIETVLTLWFSDIQGIEDARRRRDLRCDL